MQTANSKHSSRQSDLFFNAEWQLYQKIVQNNYMGHREIYAVLDDFLVSQYQHPFTLLDLGCGDASLSAQILCKTSITAYWGVDLSETALKLAQDNMKNVPGEKVFLQENLLDVILRLEQNPQPSFDIIFSSFALHHLNIEQKDRILSQLRQLLKAEGIFLLIDVIRQPGEDRTLYLKNYLENVRQSWSLLTPQEFSKVEEHISSSDFPETEESFYALAEKHQFSQVTCLYNDPINRTQLLCFFA